MSKYVSNFRIKVSSGLLGEMIGFNKCFNIAYYKSAFSL